MSPNLLQACDVLIIGSGAGGSAAAWRLVQAGKRVLMLEKGEELPEDGSTLDPALVASGHFNSKESWTDATRKLPFTPEEHFNIGGKTRWYGAALLRFDANEFAAEPDHGLLAWPFSYEELEPFYREAEALLDVRTFDNEPDLRRMLPPFAASGWQRRPLALGLSADIAAHPNEQTHFDGYAVPGGYKADARHRMLDRLVGNEGFHLEAGATVTELIPDAANPLRVTGVRCTDGREFHAPVILLAAGAMHSPRLLERYLADTGLAARLPAARSVGRYFKRHILTAVIGFGWRIKQDRICKTAGFVHRDYPHCSLQPLGGWADREAVRALMPTWLPKWITEFFALRAYGFFLQTEDGSHEDNRVIEGKPPMLDYSLDRMPKLAAEHRGMVRSFSIAMLRAGLIPFAQRIALQGTAHCAGTLVTGTDPASSVVDPEGRVHGFENLHVVDGSVLPRLGRLNPALSIYAWALRTASLLVR